MYRFTLRSPFCRQSSLHCYLCQIHVRRLASTDSVPVVNSDQHAIETLEPWQENAAISLAKNKKDAKDIAIDDLTATLEAHRASNRAPVIRHPKTTVIKTGGLRKGPLFLEQGNDGDSGAEKIHEEIREEKEGEVALMWPLDSVQAKAKYGEKGCKSYYKKGDVLEYIGAVVRPQGPWKQNRSLRDTQDTPMKRPWLAYMRTTGEDNLERLTNEIKAYEAYMRLSPREEAASELVISDVNSVARNSREMQPLTLLGSRSTGLATPTSDFDFSSPLPEHLLRPRMVQTSTHISARLQYYKRENKAKAVKILERMKIRFHLSRDFRKTELVRNARVPILRCTHVATGLEVQIQTMAPYQATHEHKLASLTEFTSLRPLYIILRSFLELRNLTTVYEGGLGSYSILMMIVTALKHSNGKFASDDLGSQLLYVLDFYGSADLYKVGFSANPPRTFEKRKGPTLDMARITDPQLRGINLIQTLDPRKPYLLCLQDPANEMNDLGKNAYAIKHVQATFRYEKHNIENRCLQKSDSRESYLGFLEADYGDFELRRSRIERWADPTMLNGRDYTEERILRDYEKRVMRYNVVAKEDDNSPKPTLEAVDGNPAESIKTADGMNSDTGFPQSPQRLAGTRSTSKFREATEKVIEARKQLHPQSLRNALRFVGPEKVKDSAARSRAFKLYKSRRSKAFKSAPLTSVEGDEDAQQIKDRA